MLELEVSSQFDDLDSFHHKIHTLHSLKTNFHSFYRFCNIVQDKLKIGIIIGCSIYWHKLLYTYRGNIVKQRNKCTSRICKIIYNANKKEGSINKRMLQLFL